jgi:hypothetical protein
VKGVRRRDSVSRPEPRSRPPTNPPVTAFPMEHINAITSWAIDAKGETRHVYT